eukprot:6197987-Pleurochrysis_carterae.AAC.1
MPDLRKMHSVISSHTPQRRLYPSDHNQILGRSTPAIRSGLRRVGGGRRSRRCSAPTPDGLRGPCWESVCSWRSQRSPLPRGP